MFDRVLGYFLPGRMPVMSRPSYRRELTTAMTFPLAVSLVEGGVIGVLAQKVFNVSEWAFATIVAAPMFANLTSFAWAHLARGRRKVPFIVALQSAVLLLVASIGLLPRTPAGGDVLVVVVVVARCLLAGIVTIRSTIWRNNYPRSERAKVTARLVQVTTLLVAVGPYVGYALQDYDARAFRLLYPAAAVVAVIGVVAFAGIRLRGERGLLRYEGRPELQPQGETAPVFDYTGEESKLTGHNIWTILRDDRRFRQYMVWQFVAGMANMMGEVALIALIVRWTEGAHREYGDSILLTTTVPMAVTMLILPFWARYLDKVHIATFRTRHGLVWIVSQGGLWLAAFWIAHGGSIWVLLLPRLLQGFGRAAGMLAWNLGHNDFADRKLVAVYMGVHVTLTGIRGAMASYLAVVLLNVVGIHIFIITTVLAVVAEVGFVHLNRSIHHTRSASLDAGSAT